MNISDFLISPSRLASQDAPEADALRETDALIDAALLGMKFDATLMALWLLFDCRGALNMQDGNTAILVVQSVTDLRWNAEPRQERRWRAVMSWTPVMAHSNFRCEAAFLNVGQAPGEKLSFSGSRAEFHVGDIPGGDNPPPDFVTGTDDEIRAGLASWESPFSPVHSSFA